MKLFISVTATVIFLFVSLAGAAPVVGRTVQLVYIAPSDRPYQAHYEAAIQATMENVVHFFESELDSRITYSIMPVQVIMGTSLIETTTNYYEIGSCQP